MRRFAALCLAAALGLTACVSVPESYQDSDQGAVQEMTALQQMEIAFDGDHSQEEIEPVLREAMRLYGLDWTEDARSRAGSVVVELRREFGPSEMEILDYMIRSHVEGVNVDFPEGAALAVTFLRSGDS